MERRRCEMTTFNPKFTITNHMTATITQIERARGFLEAARLSDEWVRDMGNKALIKEATSAKPARKIEGISEYL